jgi:hypothetical protein
MNLSLFWSPGYLQKTREYGHVAMIPRRAGDRVKTGRRDATSLTRLHRPGKLTAVWVPDAGHKFEPAVHYLLLEDYVQAVEARRDRSLWVRIALATDVVSSGDRHVREGAKIQRSGCGVNPPNW